MDISTTLQESKAFSEIIHLTDNIKWSSAANHYCLKQYRLESGHLGASQSGVEYLSVLVTNGVLEVSNAGFRMQLRCEEGCHILPRSRFMLRSTTERATFLVASAREHSIESVDSAHESEEMDFMPLSAYTVFKPWGWERWYTQNAPHRERFALKLIYMNKGHQSSLQSHVHKSETNMVIHGRAKVLSGVDAPTDHQKKIDISVLDEKIFDIGTGWSNRVNELHRVIAIESYKAVEISTPELDDVIRWEDTAGRTHGRIEDEHLGNAGG